MDKKKIGELVFYLGNKYFETYSKLMKAQITEDGIIMEHEIVMEDGEYKKDFAFLLNSLGEWLTGREEFMDVVVGKMEVQLPMVFIHLEDKNNE